MKCWICGHEMRNSMGGNWVCDHCHMGAINDGILRYPQNTEPKTEEAEKSIQSIQIDKNTLENVLVAESKPVMPEIVKQVLDDVRETLAILMVYGEYCDCWKIGDVKEFIDKVIETVTKKYTSEAKPDE